jgi:hypothetical protein
MPYTLPLLYASVDAILVELGMERSDGSQVTWRRAQGLGLTVDGLSV